MTVPESIAQIKEFITEHFPCDKTYFGKMRGKTFKFSPGHAAKLRNFIAEIQSNSSALHLMKPKNKGKPSYKHLFKPIVMLEPHDIYM